MFTFIFSLIFTIFLVVFPENWDNWKTLNIVGKISNCGKVKFGSIVTSPENLMKKFEQKCCLILNGLKRIVFDRVQGF